jgi:CheY-like chemotaxis protein/DNA-binding CsgD family transcriptional regulator
MATVLIVDDEPDIVLLVRINMEMDGHEVLAAADGEEALAVVAQRRPDAIVLDVMMPKLDGWAVLERLKRDEDEAVRTIPVVMLTALGSGQDQVRGGIEGAVRYLPKPVAPEELIAAVRSATEGEPEPVQRKAAQQRALERLARIERGADGPSASAGTPRPRLGRLEHPRSTTPLPTTPSAGPGGPIDVLTDKQRALLRTLKATASVTDAADELGMSRSNIYASLRRVGRKLDLTDVGELLRRLRDGRLDPVIEE